MLDPQIVIDILHKNLTPLREWLEKKTVTEIMINPGGYVFVEDLGELIYVGQKLSETQIKVLLQTVGKTVGQPPKANSASAIVYASVGDIRIAGALDPVSPGGSFLTIRKHLDKEMRPDLAKLIEWKMLTQKQADLLVKLIVKDRLNCMVGGGTGSGKTTLLGAILQELPEHERIMSIEDSREMIIKVKNYIPLLINLDQGVTARHLVKLAMRSRPDRLLLGETRGDETYDLIRAFNSGHPGSISTIHGDSAYESLDALEMLYQMSLPDNASISAELAREYIAKAVKLVLFVNRSIQMIDGKAKVVRRLDEICLVKGVENGRYVLESAE